MENSPNKIPSGTSFSFKKKERLCSKKQMDKLFTVGSSFLVYPLKIVYARVDFSGPYPVKAAFTAGRRQFKKAVERNLIKRRMREAYRLRKHVLYSDKNTAQTAIIFIYIAKEIHDFHSIEKAMQKSIAMLHKKITLYP